MIKEIKMKQSPSKKKKKYRSRTKPPANISPALIESLNRLPDDPRLRLAWVVDLVEKPKVWPKEPEEREKLKTDIYTFVARDGLTVVSGIGPYVKTHPAEKVATVILNDWFNMIRSALKREKIHVADAETSLMWWPPKKRYIERTDYPDYYEVAAVRAIAKLLIQYGHLIKQCPAPALRGRKGETCETVFVASRPNEIYCSSTCQSRKTTAASRERKTASKPKAKIRRAK